MPELPRDPTFDWPSVFRSGDVVRFQGGQVGVVLLVGDYSGDRVPRYELHVDTTDGVGIVEPWEVTVDNGPAAREEAVRLGLQGLR